MTWLDWLAGAVLFLQWPIPIFWLILHSLIGFWRRRRRAAYWVAGLTAWGGIAALLAALRGHLFAGVGAPLWAVIAGLVLLATEVAILLRVERELGFGRMVGRTELAGGGELHTQGLYARVRHPRYAGMMLAVLGACLLAGTLLMWVLSAAWLSLALLAILLEERELRARFGAAYDDYARRVPALFPVRLRLRE